MLPSAHHPRVAEILPIMRNGELQNHRIIHGSEDESNITLPELQLFYITVTCKIFLHRLSG